MPDCHEILYTSVDSMDCLMKSHSSQQDYLGLEADISCPTSPDRYHQSALDRKTSGAHLDSSWQNMKHSQQSTLHHHKEYLQNNFIIFMSYKLLPFLNCWMLIVVKVNTKLKLDTIGTYSISCVTYLTRGNKRIVLSLL